MPASKRVFAFDRHTIFTGSAFEDVYVYIIYNLNIIHLE
jgi:hypothetical protein